MKCIKCNSTLLDDQKICKDCGALENLDVKIEYFAISQKRLFILSFFTLGLYKLYWFYKNWNAVKKAENSDIYPSLRAVFSIFFCHSLFEKIFNSAKSEGYPNRYSHSWLATTYVVLAILGYLLIQIKSQNLYLDFAILILPLITVLPFLPVQAAINFNHDQITGHANLRKGFSWGEVVTIMVGFVVFSLSVYVIILKLSVGPSTNELIKFSKIENYVKVIKKEVTFPQQIDEVTTLVDVSAHKNSIRYHYNISSMNGVKTSNESLKNILAANICKKIKPLLNEGINVDYSYEVQDTGEKYFTSFSQNDCKEYKSDSKRFEFQLI